MQLELTPGGLDPSSADAHEIMRVISEAAAVEANRLILNAGLLPDQFAHNVFREAGNQSAVRGGGLAITYDDALRDKYGPQPGWLEAMANLGREAMITALKDNARLLVGLMLGHARQGRSLFDLFPSPPAQLRLPV